MQMHSFPHLGSFFKLIFQSSNFDIRRRHWSFLSDSEQDENCQCTFMRQATLGKVFCSMEEDVCCFPHQSYYGQLGNTPSTTFCLWCCNYEWTSSAKAGCSRWKSPSRRSPVHCRLLIKTLNPTWSKIDQQSVRSGIGCEENLEEDKH